MYSSYLLTNSALDGGEWTASRPGSVLSPGNRGNVRTVYQCKLSRGTGIISKSQFTAGG
jgi:hypothetical protein